MAGLHDRNVGGDSPRPDSRYVPREKAEHRDGSDRVTPCGIAGTARALWVTGCRQAELREEEVREPSGDEALVRAIVSLVSAGTEMNVFRGQVASFEELALPTTVGMLPSPIKFAYQVVGRVEQVGRASRFRPGDVVFANHPHQELFTLSTSTSTEGGINLVEPVPEGLAVERAAFANLYKVACNGLLSVPVRIGDVAVVSGLGIIGMFVGFLARRTASRLILIDPLEPRRASAEWLGADAVVDPVEARLAVDELSGGRGADVHFEASGSPAALQTAIDTTGVEGQICVLSYYGSQDVTLRLSPEFHLRRQRIVGSLSGRTPAEIAPRWDASRRMKLAMRELGHIDVGRLVSHRLPFADAPRAYALIDREPAETLGVLLDYVDQRRSPSENVDA